MKSAIKRGGHLMGALGAILLLTLLIATLPSLFSFGRPSNVSYYSNYDQPTFKGDKLYKLHFHPDNLWRKPILYFRQLKDGEIFNYKEGKTSRNYLRQAPRHFKLSLSYLSLASIVSLLGGLYISLKGAEKKRTLFAYEFLSFMTIVPDFILILILQFLFYQLNRLLGGEVVRVSSLSLSHRAVFLPLAVMCCYPTLYITRTLGSQLKGIYHETYILFARAKGLSPAKIRYFHLGPAAVHMIRGDLHKILAILFMNLFITELMFNIKGLTAFLFSNISQYAFTVNTIILALVLYLITYTILYLVLTLLGRFLRRDTL